LYSQESLKDALSQEEKCRLQPIGVDVAKLCGCIFKNWYIGAMKVHSSAQRDKCICLLIDEMHINEQLTDILEKRLDIQT